MNTMILAIKDLALKINKLTDGNSWVVLVFFILIIIYIYCRFGGFIPFFSNNALTGRKTRNYSRRFPDSYLNNGILYSFSGQPIININTGEFLQKYTDEQKRVLGVLLDKHIDITLFAYPEINEHEYEKYAEYVKILWYGIDMNRGKKNLKEAEEKFFRLRLVLWKLIRINLPVYIKDRIAECMEKDLKTAELLFSINNIPDVLWDYSVRMRESGYGPRLLEGYEILEHLVVQDLEDNTDNIGKINNGVDIEDLYEYDEKTLRKAHNNFYYEWSKSLIGNWYANYF